MSRKFYHVHQISLRNSENSAADCLQKIITNSELEIFTRNIMNTYKTQMARQIITAQKQSIQQTSSNTPRPPYIVPEDPKPIRGVMDTIRPYSAKIQKRKKSNSNTNSSSQLLTVTKGNSIIRTSPSIKSFKSVNNFTKTHKVLEKSQLSKYRYKSKVVPLSNNQKQNQQCDKLIEKLRKKKLKAQEYQKSKQFFLNLIGIQNQQNNKKQAKFASSMGRKEYTYSNTGQIVEICKKKKGIKRIVNNQSTIKGLMQKKSQQDQKKEQTILIEFGKRQPRVQLKQFIFGNGQNSLEPKIVCPSNSNATKFTVYVSDL